MNDKKIAPYLNIVKEQNQEALKEREKPMCNE